MSSRRKKLVYVAIATLLIMTICSYFIRSVYFAPIGESNIPNEYTATCMSVAAFIGYSPNYWGFPFFGFVLDTFKNFQYIFLSLLCLSIIGIIINYFNNRLIIKSRDMNATKEM